MKINWYTSYYQKMSTRAKTDFDVYVQVSRSVVCYAKDKNGKAISKLINIDLGELLGNTAWSLKGYYRGLKFKKREILNFIAYIKTEFEKSCKAINEGLINEYGKSFNELTYEEALKAIQKTQQLTEEEAKNVYKTKDDMWDLNVFLLCHENLESRYTKKDEENFKGLKGDYKVCHRRVLAQWLEKHAGLHIPEWNIAKENESIVYRPYFKMPFFQ